MDSENDQVLGVRPETSRVQDPAEASHSSLDSSEPSSGVRGIRRRRHPAVTPPGSHPQPAPGTRTSARVLRARSAAADEGTAVAKNAGKQLDHARRVLGSPAGPRSRNAPAMQTLTKKTKSKQASQPTQRPKTSKTKRGKLRPPTSSRSFNPPMSEFNLAQDGADVHVSVADAVNEDPPLRDHPDDITETIENLSRRACTTPQPKDVKKEDEEHDMKGEEQCENDDGEKCDTAPASRNRSRQQKEDKGPRQPKRRKKPPVQYVRCEMEGCGTVLAHPRYLQHHIKYQHMLKKQFVCSHPSCGRLFRLQKQLLRHAKHHTDQRDYVCEHCARAFKSSHNLAVHRMIHTGEKPIQCEICGFTCRQKASLNWHMKKHDAEASYQFSCSICGKRFEKKDSVIAHKAKSHPEVLIAEALAANGGAVMSSPAPVPEAVPVPAQPSSAPGDSLTPLQQVVLPFAPHAPGDASQDPFVQLAELPVVQVTPQEQLTAAPPAQVSIINQPQLIQLSTLPTGDDSMTTGDSQTTLITLSSVTTLSSTDAAQWSREASEGGQMLREGELWDGAVVGDQDAGEATWEENAGMKTEDEVWEQEGERQTLVQCEEVDGDGLN